MSDIQPDQQPTPERNKKDKITLLLILAAFFLPFIVLPMLMSPEEMGKTNKGNFVQPHVSFEELGITSIEGGAFNREDIEGLWVILYFIPQACDKACSNALISMRQVRLAMDRNVSRVKNLVVAINALDPQLEKSLEEDFSGFATARASASVIDSIFVNALPDARASTAGFTYLMSPDGYIFMYYPSYENEQESVLFARDIVKDLKKSLKGSIE